MDFRDSDLRFRPSGSGFKFRVKGLGFSLLPVGFRCGVVVDWTAELHDDGTEEWEDNSVRSNKEIPLNV